MPTWCARSQEGEPPESGRSPLQNRTSLLLEVGAKGEQSTLDERLSGEFLDFSHLSRYGKASDSELFPDFCCRTSLQEIELEQAVAIVIRSDRSLGSKVEIQQIAVDGLVQVGFSAKALIVEAG